MFRRYSKVSCIVDATVENSYYNLLLILTSISCFILIKWSFDWRPFEFVLRNDGEKQSNNLSLYHFEGKLFMFVYTIRQFNFELQKNGQWLPYKYARTDIMTIEEQQMIFLHYIGYELVCGNFNSLREIKHSLNCTSTIGACNCRIEHPMNHSVSKQLNYR